MRKQPTRAHTEAPQEKDPIDTILEAADLTWLILKAPIKFSPEPTKGLQELEIEGYQVLYRSDTNQQLAIVSSRHRVWQPREVIDFYLSIAAFYGLAFESVGYVQGGLRIWGLLNTGYKSALPRNRSASTYLLLSTCCDSSLAAQATALCLLEPGTLATPASIGSQSVARIARSPEFLTPSDLAEIGELTRECIAFPTFLGDLAKQAVSEENIKQATAATFGPRDDDPNRPSAKTLRSIVSALREGRSSSKSPLTALDLLYALAAVSDAREQRRSPADLLNNTWFGVGAKRKQLAINALARLIRPY
ncbi:DUF932 domain-containing protein [Ramlibacter henchirensis]|uniref:DUF932 domain-containing protein n=1 Tax=Ramlibacter henchirensis TaxID=204072 RepID=A0A4Z0BX66_9BURK|nr:DUF932 domain-containing protein [Ramlibacter henchirensis]TFZ02858.1 DUF932 domain-containing protein [Ramlibacter henchirensis]